MSTAIRQEVAALVALRQHITRSLTDDEVAIRDTIEGETDLDRLFGALVQLEGETRAEAAALLDYMGELKERREGIERRAERLRELLTIAMQASGQQTWRTPYGTVTMPKPRDNVIVVNEALLPEWAWRQPEPVVDKSQINERVRAGESVPGVELRTADPSVTIRRR